MLIASNVIVIGYKLSIGLKDVINGIINFRKRYYFNKLTIDKYLFIDFKSD